MATLKRWGNDPEPRIHSTLRYIRYITSKLTWPVLECLHALHFPSADFYISLYLSMYYVYIYIPGKIAKQEHLKVAILSSRLTSQKCPSQVPGLQLRPQSSTVPAPCFNDKSFSKRLILAHGSDSEAVGMSMSIEIIEWLATSGPPIRMPPRVTLTLKYLIWIRHGNDQEQSPTKPQGIDQLQSWSQNWRFWDHHPTWHGNDDTYRSIQW